MDCISYIFQKKLSMKRIFIAICSSLVLFSCTWVKVTSKGEGVRLVQSARAVELCNRLGKVSTKVESKILFSRDSEKVEGELADLARNEAALMRGDTIVPISEINDGRRSFDVYRYAMISVSLSSVGANIPYLSASN